MPGAMLQLTSQPPHTVLSPRQHDAIHLSGTKIKTKVLVFKVIDVSNSWGWHPGPANTAVTISKESSVNLTTTDQRVKAQQRISELPSLYLRSECLGAATLQLKATKSQQDSGQQHSIKHGRCGPVTARMCIQQSVKYIKWIHSFKSHYISSNTWKME